MIAQLLNLLLEGFSKVGVLGLSVGLEESLELPLSAEEVLCGLL